MMGCIVGMLRQEVFLLLNDLVQVVEDIGDRVCVHDEGGTVCGKHLLHDLVEEVVAEVSGCDSARFLDQVLSHCKEGT